MVLVVLVGSSAIHFNRPPTLGGMSGEDTSEESEELFSYERGMDNAAIASHLRRIADKLEHGTGLSLRADGRHVEIDTERDAELEVEVEKEEDETELEIEITFAASDTGLRIE